MIRRLLNKHPITSYCLIAFSISWGFKLLYGFYKQNYGMPIFNFGIIASYGPSLSAIVLVGVTLGKDGLHQILNRIIDYRVGVGWLLLATFFEVLVFISITCIALVFDGSLIQNRLLSLGDIFDFFLTLVGGLFIWGLSEEIGWREWMLLRLQTRYLPFTSSIILAFVASFWHINPNNISDYFVTKEGVYLYGQYCDILERVIISIPFTMVITYIFNNTR